MMFKEIIIIYYENNVKPINTFSEQNEELMIIKAGGICKYHCALSVKTYKLITGLHINLSIFPKQFIWRHANSENFIIEDEDKWSSKLNDSVWTSLIKNRSPFFYSTTFR
jgi:hypothetical protein